MLLLIDIGNTKLKWALAHADAAPVSLAWQAQGELMHDALSSMSSELDGVQLRRILVSNVAGPVIAKELIALLQRIEPHLSIEWFIPSAQVAGLKNNYRRPEQLGCDRLAAAIAAHHLYPQRNMIIATCGTATTIDAVTADAIFQGGLILPGLHLMLQSLAHNTAQLPQIGASGTPISLFADNTEQAILSGVVTAQIGAITLAVQTLQQDLQQGLQLRQTPASPTQAHAEPVLCILSGGAASVIAPHMQIPFISLSNLVLTGLLVVAQSVPYGHLVPSPTLV